jgi:hypothetical protein
MLKQFKTLLLFAAIHKKKIKEEVNQSFNKALKSLIQKTTKKAQ